MAHRIRGDEAPLVRWIDTDGDGVSNFRLLCTLDNGSVRIERIVPDTTLRQRIRQAL